MIESEVILGFRSEDEAFYKNFYKTYRKDFVNFLIKRGIPETESVEIFHECIIILKRKAYLYELDKVQVSLKTYLFAIGKNKAFDHLKKLQKSIIYLSDNLPEVETDFTSEENDQELIQHIKDKISVMGKACKKLLISFYLEGLTIKEMVKRGDYENENTVSAQKSRCLKQLRESLTIQKNG
ncbi:sigma-70 family RNA polymerase sigma factor [Belliella sp. R4-6]|uniref:Sigma-70 family RNA polymerase sigma factor n=1 Tax=Belliella alkalica TaxID=1730871 RepID=A0ABS9V7R3_9BACT|nr:sigma-70 family RNA polymerase sigma factor [Belliella alkalica]MCH7412444.1 sigma-70 family RNA polymerase sigma factor [Belliella alkalica]